MSKTYEFQGKNVDQALSMASEELNIPAEKINHEVIAYGSSGIFGLVGVKKARIKVFIEEAKGNNRRSKQAEKKASPSLVTKEPAVETADEPGLMTKVDEDSISSGTQALQKIVDGITSDATVNLTQQKDKLFFTVTGEETVVSLSENGVRPWKRSNIFWKR
jgi:spoIIIJ-associated protein